jgi:hypothetical protein
VFVFTLFNGLPLLGDPFAQPWPLESKDYQAGDFSLDYQNTKSALRDVIKQRGNGIGAAWTLSTFATRDGDKPMSTQHGDILVGRDDTNDFIAGRFMAGNIVSHPSAADPLVLVLETDNFNSKFAQGIYDSSSIEARTTLSEDTLTGGNSDIDIDVLIARSSDIFTDVDADDATSTNPGYSLKTEIAALAEKPMFDAVTHSCYFDNVARAAAAKSQFPSSLYEFKDGHMVEAGMTLGNTRRERRVAALSRNGNAVAETASATSPAPMIVASFAAAVVCLIAVAVSVLVVRRRRAARGLVHAKLACDDETADDCGADDRCTNVDSSSEADSGCHDDSHGSDMDADIDSDDSGVTSRLAVHLV